MTITNRIAGQVYNLSEDEEWRGSSRAGEGALSISGLAGIYCTAQPILRSRAERLHRIYLATSGDQPEELEELEGLCEVLAERTRRVLGRWVYESYLTDRVMDFPRIELGRDAAAEPGRMTYDYLRRGSLGTLGGVLATQAVYLLTGTLIVHPLFALLLSAVAVAFYAMSKYMERDIEQLAKQ